MLTAFDYWNQYYADKHEPAVPSQFANFVLNEFNHKSRFVDIGCGDGRDSLFFAHFNKSVLGLDGSDSAIENCQTNAKNFGFAHVGFTTLNMNATDDIASFLSTYEREWSGAVVYSRFFLHAIDEGAQVNFLNLASRLAASSGSVCLEFRTPRDEFQTKVTAAHYRRYVNPLAVIEQSRGYGLTCAYFVEGFGFAKYKSDDAYVARMILEPA